MELWIRSQDKEILAKTENINIRCSCDEMPSLGVYYISIGNLEIAKYKTKERALEVLDEIQKLIDPVLVFKNCECDNDTLKAIKEIGACMVSDNAHIEQVQTCIYEMPKE